MMCQTGKSEMKENSKLISLAGSVRNAYNRLTTSALFTSLLLVSVIGWEFGVLLLKASRRRFWYDELLTFHLSTLHPFSLLWSALQAGADGMPPGYYVIVQLARLLPGDPHVTLRLPSIIGYILTLLGVYWFARKKLPVLAALTAVLLISLSPFRSYALEARSYSLVVGFLAISAVLWQRIDEKRFMKPLLAVFLTLAVSCHHLAVVAIACFGMAELTWTCLSSRIRWGVWAACLLATGPFFLGLPLLLHFREIFGKNFWSQPGWVNAVSTYGRYLGLDVKPALVLIVLFGIVVCASQLRMLGRLRDGTPKHDFSLPEIVLVGGFLSYPALLVVLTKLLNSGYTARYGWPAIFGLVLGSVYLLRSTWAASSHLLVALLIAFAYQAGGDANRLRKAAGSTTVGERWTRLEALCRDEPGIPVVIASGKTYLEAAQYSPPALHDRLVEVVDTETATRLTGTDSVDTTNLHLAQFIPLRVEDLAPFEAAHQMFLLYSGGGFDWFTPYLVEKKYNLRLLSNNDSSSVYIVER
jgi:hypothetical protein